MHYSILSLSVLVGAVIAFPALSGSGLDPAPRGRDSLSFDRRAAAPYSPLYPYTGANIDGLPGSQIGGVLVPAPGDSAHAFQHPPVGAFRGPW